MFNLVLRQIRQKLKNLLVGKKQSILSKFNNTPKSLVRICMLITQNGNHIDKTVLSSKLVQEGIVSSSSCNRVLSRGILDYNILKEENGYISVIDPSPYVVKRIRGSVLDTWKAFIIPTLIIAIVWNNEPFISAFFGIVSFLGVCGWFIEDWLYTEKF